MSELYLIGIGPGNPEQMTGDAVRAIRAADVLCGYTVYVELAQAIAPEKEIFTTPMTQEMERCRWAVDTAASGRSVAMLCSGDTGVYGMAGPVLTLAAERPEVEVIVIPGVTAAISGAAVLGAPLMNDFCVISLSDRLTPWEIIAHRLRSAAEGGFSVCLYNPASRLRRDHLQRACDIFLEARSPETVCGWVRNIGRDGQEKKILTLGELRDEEVDMFTTVFIGAEETAVIGERMVTPRGYGRKRGVRA